MATTTLEERRFCHSMAMFSTRSPLLAMGTGLGIEVCEVCELGGELMAQPWVGENLPIEVAVAALHERCN